MAGPLWSALGVKVSALPADSVTVSLLAALPISPTVIAVPSILVICAVPSKLSAPDTSLLPLTGLKVMAVSSLVVTASGTVEQTAELETQHEAVWRPLLVEKE